jgi:hypothetical protein
MEVKWFFIAVACVAFSVSLMLASNAYNATKAGLEECPKYGAGKGGDAIWVKSCKEYSDLIAGAK